MCPHGNNFIPFIGMLLKQSFLGIRTGGRYSYINAQFKGDNKHE
jgi:hypothetical protein